MKLIKKFIALDLRYLETKNTGLARYAINISKYLVIENKNKNKNKKLNSVSLFIFFCSYNICLIFFYIVHYMKILCIIFINLVKH